MIRVELSLSGYKDWKNKERFCNDTFGEIIYNQGNKKQERKKNLNKMYGPMQPIPQQKKWYDALTFNEEESPWFADIGRYGCGYFYFPKEENATVFILRYGEQVREAKEVRNSLEK